MKTRYSSLVTLKKNKMQKSERVVQNANATLNSATTALEISSQSIYELTQPHSGAMSDFLASRTLLDSKRQEIEHNKEWVAFAKAQLASSREELKTDMIEYEKFKYLELQEIKKILQKQKIQEMKDLDEVALMTHARNKEKLKKAV
jgi:flagellar biosynthesis chaperone FliJ